MACSTSKVGVDGDGYIARNLTLDGVRLLRALIELAFPWMCSEAIMVGSFSLALQKLCVRGSLNYSGSHRARLDDTSCRRYYASPRGHRVVLCSHRYFGSPPRPSWRVVVPSLWRIPPIPSGRDVVPSL